MADYGVATSNRDNPEHKALTESFPKLVVCITKSPGEITDELIAFTIFSTNERENLRSSRLSDREKAQMIMDIVMSNVESEPSFLSNFIGIIEKHDWMKSCTDELKRNFKAEQKSQEPIMMEPTFVDVMRSALAMVTPPIPSIDIFTSLSSQNKIESQFDRFDESDLENKTDKIKQRFAVLVTSIIMALKREGVTTEDLTSLFKELGSVRSDHIEVDQVCYFNNEFMQQIEEECQSDVGKVFPVIRKCYSWINFDLIESIKDTFLTHNNDIQTKWKDYQTHYKEYCKERVCNIPKPINGTRLLPKLLQKSTTVAFKIDCEWHEIRFDRLNGIQASIKRLLNLESYTLYLKTVKQGCVELVFEVPQHVADVIFPPTEEQLLALQEHTIIYCGELIIPLRHAYMQNHFNKCTSKYVLLILCYVACVHHNQ